MFDLFEKLLPKLASGRHRVENACDDLRGTRAAHFVAGFRFQQFRIREDDSELVVQAVKEGAEFWPFVHRRPRRPVSGRHDASLVVSSGARPGSRHSVSAKMRTDPPAVRMYSTFPLEIQL